MKKPSEELFLLIKSMNGNEKGYFKKISSSHYLNSFSLYVQIFNLIDQQQQYNEIEILTLLKGEVNRNTFKRMKNYLYGILLKTLSAYNLQHSIQMEVVNNFLYIEILCHKSLFDQANQILHKTENTIREAEIDWLLPITHYWKFRVLSKDYSKNINQTKVEHSWKQHQSDLDKLTVYNDLIKITKKVRLMELNNIAFRDNTELEWIFKDIVLAESKLKKLKLNSFNVFHLLLLNKANFYGLKKDLEKKLHYMQRLLRLFESKNIYIESRPVIYLNVLHNLAGLEVKLKGNFNSIIKKIEKMKLIPAEMKNKGIISENIQLISVGNAYSIELHYYIENKKYNRGLLMIDEVLLFISKNKRKLPHSFFVSLLLNMTILNMYSKNFDIALELINKLLNDRKDPSIVDYFCIGNLLNLIIHYELGNYDLLPFLSRSTARYLTKHHRLKEVEILLINFFKKVDANNVNAKKRGNIFRKLQIELKKMKHLPEDSLYFIFDFEVWARNHALKN